MDNALYRNNELIDNINYMHPNDVYYYFGEIIRYNDLVHILQNSPFFNQEFYINNNNNHYSIEFHYKQFYVRYLLRMGLLQEATEQLLDIHVYQNHNQYTLEDFLNYQHPSFNGDTILHFALMWNASLQFIRWIINNGADVNVENMQHHLPGEFIHNTPWYDPFAIYLNLPLLVTDNTGRTVYRNQNHFQAIQWFLQYIGEQPL